MELSFKVDNLSFTEGSASLPSTKPNIKNYMAFKTTGVKTADFKAAEGSGVLERVIVACADAAPTAGTITIYDGTNALGTILYQETFTTTAFRAYSVDLGCVYNKGLYMDFTTTADVNVTLIYQ